MILVRCERCTRRLGAGTRLGEMVLFPDSRGGKWGWLPWGRQAHGLAGGGRTVRRKSVDVLFSGGVEIQCRRCGASPRMAVRMLAQRAADTHRGGLTEFVV
jgi:hypothetical protein